MFWGRLRPGGSTLGAELSGVFGSALSLSDELRQQLGLDPDETIRVLDSHATGLVLERSCSQSPMAVPWDRDLTLSAEVWAFPLADILSMIHGAVKSGFLYFRFQDTEKSVLWLY